MDHPFFDDNTWLISDTHFFHANIGQYCNRPNGWQDLIVTKWNHFIQPRNTVFHLGDLAFGKKDDLEALLEGLNGKLYLMRGNHDRHSTFFYETHGITLVSDPYRIRHVSKLELIFSHRPIVPLESGVLNLHGHIHNHATPELGSQHVNLSIETRQYRPWQLGDILQPYFA